jgi:hypothetical protein
LGTEVGGLSEVVEHPSSKCEVLSSNPSVTKKQNTQEPKKKKDFSEVRALLPLRIKCIYGAEQYNKASFVLAV